MNKALPYGIGMGVGVALYQVIAHGFADADWYRAVFVGVFSCVVMGIYFRVKEPSENSE